MLGMEPVRGEQRAGHTPSGRTEPIVAVVRLVKLGGHVDCTSGSDHPAPATLRTVRRSRLSRMDLDGSMGVGAFAGLVAAILILSISGAGLGFWVLGLIMGPVIGAIMMGMVS